MIYKHGAVAPYEIPVHVLNVNKRPTFNADNVLVESTTSFVLTGKVSGTDQSSLKTAILAFESAFLNTRVSKSGFYHSDGTTESAHMIDLTGVVSDTGIVCEVNWIDTGAQYVTYRNFLLTVSATILGAGADEYEYQNQITRIGNGGPPKVPRRCQGGVVVQQPYPATEFLGVETGRKVSRAGVVFAKAPSYPAILQNPEYAPTIGQYTSEGITRYFAAWTYNYVSTGPF